MGQYYFAVFLGDAPKRAAIQKQIEKLQKLLQLKDQSLDIGITLGMSTPESKESELEPLRAKIEQLKSAPIDGEFIRAWLNPHAYTTGVKLTEHAYGICKVVQTAHFLLSPEGHFYKTRLVWAGDYADPEPDDYTPMSKDEGKCDTLHMRAYDQPLKCYTFAHKTKGTYNYFVNHDKREAVDLRRFQDGTMPHPIPLLTAEGNGRGGGDYRGKGEEFVGIWARSVVSVEAEPPEGFVLRDDIVFDEDA